MTIFGIMCDTATHPPIQISRYCDGELKARSAKCWPGPDEFADTWNLRCPLCRLAVSLRIETMQSVAAIIDDHPELLTAQFWGYPALSLAMLARMAGRAKTTKADTP